MEVLTLDGIWRTLFRFLVWSQAFWVARGRGVGFLPILSPLLMWTFLMYDYVVLSMMVSVVSVRSQL